MARFEQYLAEFRETQQAVNAVTDSTYKLYNDYGYAAGYYGSMVADLIAQLPKAKRAEYRERLRQKAKEFENQYLLKQIKETA
jgi:glucan phosphoethanolaminetransferase (alkaline phosphatase superfamily)